MNCPECNHEFGYLLLDNLEKVGELTVFNCPKCNQKLNNRPIKEITNKASWYIYGGLILLTVLLSFDYLLFGSSINQFIKYASIAIGVVSLSLGYHQYQKLDSKIYYENES